MNADIDWTALTRASLYPPDAQFHDDAPGVGRRVRSQHRRMIAAVLGEYAVAALLAGVAIWHLAAGDRLDAFVRGFALFWFTAMAVQFSAANRRGLWQPAGESIRAYLELALERVRRREATVRFAWLLYALQVLLVVAWYPATCTRQRGFRGHWRRGRSSRRRRRNWRCLPRFPRAWPHGRLLPPAAIAASAASWSS